MATTSGKSGKGAVGSTPVAIGGLQQWDIEEPGDVLDATDAESGGVEDTDVGVIGVRGTVRGVHKITSGPYPTFRTGSILTTLKLNLDSTTANALWTFPVAIVTRCTSGIRVRGQMEYSFEFRNKGIYTGPTV
jgi:hypothetical protein